MRMIIMLLAGLLLAPESSESYLPKSSRAVPGSCSARVGETPDISLSGILVTRPGTALRLSEVTGPELLNNGTFSAYPRDKWVQEGSAQFTWAPEVYRSGLYSLKIWKTTTSSAYAQWATKLGKSGIGDWEPICFSAYLKTVGVSEYASVELAFQSLSGTPLFEVESSTQVTGTTDWTKVEVCGNIPYGTYFIKPSIRLYGLGTIWVDDLSLKKQLVEVL